MVPVGLVLAFEREDRISEARKAALSAQDLAHLTKKRLLTLSEIELVAEGATIISRVSNNYATCGGYADALPFLLKFGESLADIDQRLGDDILEETEDDDEGRRSRRWDFTIKRPRVDKPGQTEPLALKLILGFQKKKLIRVRVILA
jgi:hypothetical protein